MAFVTGGFTHGGNGLLKQLMREMLASGLWTVKEHINQRAGALAAAPIAQNHTRAVSVSVSGLPVNTDIHLPVCMIQNWVARKNNGSVATLGVDYSIDPALGTFRILSGGFFQSGGVGLAATSFTLDANYEERRGWIVLTSTGVSTQETIYVGLQFDTIANGWSENPVKSGSSTCVFSSWVIGVTDWQASPITVRNSPTDDVLFFVKPNIEGTYQFQITADRVLAFGETDGQRAWMFAGGLARFRPLIEQPVIVAVTGNTAGDEDDDEGPAGKTNEPGQMSKQMGSVWLYDLGRFADGTNPVEMNANYWVFDASNTLGVGQTPSQAVLNVPGPGGTPQYYFELHDVVIGRNTALLNNQGSILYGLVAGLKTLLVFDARQDLELTFEGIVYRLWRVGSSSRRFVAIQKA